MTRRSRGFALLAVLWVCIALGTLAADAVDHARADAAVSGTAVATIRARWAAEGCLAVGQSRLDAILASGRALELPPGDTLFLANGARCVLDSYDPSARFNRDSMSAADAARFDSALAVSGLAHSAARDTLETVYGDGRINLNRARPVVIATLPGITPEAIRVLVEARAWRGSLHGLDELAARLSPAGRAALLEHYPELLPRVSFRTGALVLGARGWTDGSPASATIEVLAVNGGNRAAVIQRRMF